MMRLFEQRQTDEELAEIAGKAIATAAIEREKNNSRKMLVTAIAVLAIIITAIISIGVGRVGSIISNGTSKGISEVSQIIEDTAQGVYDQFYQASYDHAERQNHVSNRATIVIRDVQETAKLNVLEVSEVYYVIENEEDNDKGITAWLGVTGYGAFTVDLSSAEYIVDNARHSVLVRLPSVMLDRVWVDETCHRVNFANDWKNDSYQVGVELFESQIKEAKVKITEAFNNDPQYIERAERNAIIMITNFISEVNSDIPDLTVTVEFME